MRKGVPHLSALKRTLAMLEAVIQDGGKSNISEIARTAGIPVATAHRHIATLAAEGYLTCSQDRRYIAGTRLRDLARLLDEKQIVTTMAVPILHRLAADARGIAQLGTLETDMVTYRVKTGMGANALFTKVGMQLEAYCSGIGKILLAHLQPDEQERYLSGGPFIALTDRTITEPGRLRREFAAIRETGFAVDDGEIAPGLCCVAVPIRRRGPEVIAAISVSRATDQKRPLPDADLARLLNGAARQIENAAFGECQD